MPTTKRRPSPSRTAPETAAVMARLGKRLKALRAAATLTQQEAATKAGIMSTYLQVVERGTANPSLAVLAALARAYGITLAEMFEGV